MSQNKIIEIIALVDIADSTIFIDCQLLKLSLSTFDY